MQVCPEEFGYEVDVFERRYEDVAKLNDIFVLEVFQQLQFSVCPLGQDRCAEGLHNLLYGDILVLELIFRGTDEAKSTHAHGLQIRVSRRDLERRSKDLCSYEFGHGECRTRCGRGGLRDVRCEVEVRGAKRVERRSRKKA